MATLPTDYEERVYAGVLGKIIGVYLGRPFEGWNYGRIIRELGEVNYYVNDRIAHHPPLIVTDDDISGTFTFLRALPDYGNTKDITAAQIGQTWLNYLIERQTILWWGGMGASTEHTAYQRLKRGVIAPRSGSIELNSKVVAEQIGAQIFIDGWAMVAPGNPALAVELAGKAASVSHDGEAVYGAQVLAAMEAQAFIESDMNKLFDTGVSFVPADSIIAHLIADVRAWRKSDNDWRKTRDRIEAKYGYDKYGGGCHMVPNHALIILALAYAPDDFQRALMIGNTCGWDTDCNSANIGCFMGIKLGLDGINRSVVDWRTPVADRIYLPTADGGRCITDAVQETYRIAAIGRALANELRVQPAARFSFELSGSVQGFMVRSGEAKLENVVGYSGTGKRSLAIHHNASAEVGTATFIPPDAQNMPGYGLIASPTLYPGQVISAGISSETEVMVNLYAKAYTANDVLMLLDADTTIIHAGETKTLQWDTHGMDATCPIAEVGVQIVSDHTGTVYLDYLTWTGAPTMTITKPEHNGTLWKRAWIKACDDHGFGWGWTIVACQDAGTGLLIQGEREWANYTLSAEISPHMAKSAGIAACVQGLKRYYALLLCHDKKARLVKVYTHNPGYENGVTQLAETEYDWELDGTYQLSLTTQGNHLIASIDAKKLFDVEDIEHPLRSGAIALVIEEGRLNCNTVSVIPA